MDDFIEKQLAANIRAAVGRAKVLLARGDGAAAMDICRQILKRDHTAPGPLALSVLHSEQIGDWPAVVELGMMLLRTRPECEKTFALEADLEITYADVAGKLVRAADQLAGALNGTVPALALLGRGIAHHIRGDFDAARADYEAVLVAGPDARRLVGEAINLLHALEHQAGNPEAAKRWLDLETFPLRLHIADLHRGDWRGFCDALFDEVMVSPRLKDTSDPQSRGWIVGDRLNDPGHGPRIAELEAMFRDLLTRRREAFADLGHDFVHSVFRDFPDDHRIKIFCAMLRGRGHVGPHLHNDGYLVGSLYVRVPDEPDSPGMRNAIEHGKHTFHAATGGGYPTRTSVPEAGTILMWPAYYCHSVPPSRATTPRMVVGFDLVPVT